MAAYFLFSSYGFMVFIVPEPENSKKLPEYYRYFKFYKNNDWARGFLEGYSKQSDFCQRRLCTWLYLIASYGDPDGLVPSSEKYYWTLDSVCKKYSSSGLRSPGSYFCRCRKKAADYRYYHRNFSDHDNHNLSGSHQYWRLLLWQQSDLVLLLP